MEDNLTNTKKVGIVWDNYTSAVEAQICRDIIALINQPGQSADTIVVCSEFDRADRLLAALGVRRIPMESLASLWLVYKTMEYPVIAPEHATEVVVRDFWSPIVDGNIDPEARNGYYLKRGDRPIPNQLNMRKPPPSAYIPIDPALVLLYS